MTNINPMVSIIIPVYNSAPYLQEAIQSVQGQTYTDWELIMIDDGSSDESGLICEELSQSDPRISLIRQKNAGVSVARNRGLDNAHGKYVTFIDSDDVIKPTYLEKMVAAAEKYQTEMVLCGFCRFSRDSVIDYLLGGRVPVGLFSDLQSFLWIYGDKKTHMFGISVWAKLYRMDIIRQNCLGFDSTIRYEEDCVFNTGYFDCINSVAVVGEILYSYRQREGALSKVYHKNTYDFLVNGYKCRCRLLKKHNREDLISVQDDIFMIVIKDILLKIYRSDLSEKEKRIEYQHVIDYPETQSFALKWRATGSLFSKLIMESVRKKDIPKLKQSIRLWVFYSNIGKMREKTL